MTTPVPNPAPAKAAPGKGLSVAGVIFAFLLPLLGLILSIVALVQSRGAGQKNGLAVAGIIISIAWPIIAGILFAVLGGAALFNTCAQLGPGVWDVNGVEVTCS